MIEFRELTADDIECRVAQTSEKGVQLLLYKNARVDMNILDETVGTENWSREHYECKGNLFCRVGINVNYKDPTKEPRWVYKSDCGTESNTEKGKGEASDSFKRACVNPGKSEASDSFKRACVNFGIGRSLYTSPFIWVKAENVELEDKNGKKTTYDKFAVEKVKIVNGRIVGLSIINTSQKNKRVFACFMQEG